MKKYLFICAILALGNPGAINAQLSCTSTCTGNLGENIFPNGDFGAGAANVLPNDPGFAPGYVYQPSPPPDDGYYTIGNNTAPWGWFAASEWIDIQDNGPEANGYMMVVNASFQPGLFFEKTVSVCENTLYEFSIDVISLNIPGHQVIKPNLSFLIDGVVVCETGNVPVDAKWHTYRFSFTTAPGVTAVFLAMRNNAPGGNGNDLALDNISFRACGPKIDLPLVAEYCPGKGLVLQAALSNSPYSNTFFQWQYFAPPAWTTIAGADSVALEVNPPQQGDQYRLIAASSLANLDLTYCRSVSEPVVLQEASLYPYEIAGDTVICNGSAVMLDAGDFQTYLWSTGENTRNLTIQQPGLYAVTVTSAPGCIASDSIFVPSSFFQVAIITKDLQCAGDNSGRIEAEAINGSHPPYEFLLEGNPSGGVFSGLAAGTYSLEVQDSLLCTFSATLTLQEPPPLEVEIQPLPVIALGDTVAVSVITNRPVTWYTWQLPGLFACAACDVISLSPAPGTVVGVTVVDDAGCSAFDSLRLEIQPRTGIYAPNIFYPGAAIAGENDFFTLFTPEGAVQLLRFDIYDRWGSLVFSRRNVIPGSEASRWYGEAPGGEKLPAAVYVWYAEIEYFDGSIVPYRGGVMLW